MSSNNLESGTPKQRWLAVRELQKKLESDPSALQHLGLTAEEFRQKFVEAHKSWALSQVEYLRDPDCNYSRMLGRVQRPLADIGLTLADIDLSEERIRQTRLGVAIARLKELAEALLPENRSGNVLVGYEADQYVMKIRNGLKRYDLTLADIGLSEEIIDDYRKGVNRRQRPTFMVDAQWLLQRLRDGQYGFLSGGEPATFDHVREQLYTLLRSVNCSFEDVGTSPEEIAQLRRAAVGDIHQVLPLVAKALVAMVDNGNWDLADIGLSANEFDKLRSGIM